MRAARRAHAGVPGQLVCPLPSEESTVGLGTELDDVLMQQLSQLGRARNGAPLTFGPVLKLPPIALPTVVGPVRAGVGSRFLKEDFPQPISGSDTVCFLTTAASSGRSPAKHMSPKNATRRGPLRFVSRTAGNHL